MRRPGERSKQGWSDDHEIERRLVTDPAFIPIYLTEAAPTPGAIAELGAVEAERARVAAVRALHTIYRNQLTTGPIDFRVLEFFQSQATRIWAGDDPSKSMARFWSAQPKRGRPNQNSSRNFTLCVAIQIRINAGENIDDVCLDLEERSSSGPLNSQTIKNIYSGRDKKAVDAQVSMSAEDATTRTPEEVAAKKQEFREPERR